MYLVYILLSSFARSSKEDSNTIPKFYSKVKVIALS